MVPHEDRKNTKNVASNNSLLMKLREFVLHDHLIMFPKGFKGSFGQFNDSSPAEFPVDLVRGLCIGITKTAKDFHKSGGNCFKFAVKHKYL